MTASLRRLAWRELRELLATSWFIGPALIALLLTPFTVYIGLIDYRARDLDHREYVARIEEARQSGQRMLVGNQVEPALRVVRPPSPGSVRRTAPSARSRWSRTSSGGQTAANNRTRPPCHGRPRRGRVMDGRQRPASGRRTARRVRYSASSISPRAYRSPRIATGSGPT